MFNINPKSIKRAVLLNDMSCFGKCSLTVAEPIITLYGVEAVPLPTAILSTHTGGFSEFTIHDMTDQMEKIAEHWKKCKIKFDFIYTGYFCNARQIDFAKKFINDFKTDNTTVLVDPVMGDNGKLYVGFDNTIVEKMKELISLADIITPNLTEAVFLTGRKACENPQEIIKDFKNTNVVITGVRNGEKIGYTLKSDDKISEILTPFYPVTLHGSGDVFASVLVGEIMSGVSFKNAVKNAASFCHRAVQITKENAEDGTYGLMFEKVIEEKLKGEKYGK